MKVPTRRVRFKVPELEYLNVKTFINAQGLTSRVWVEVLLTHLCQPQGEHPVVAQKGVTTTDPLRAARVSRRDADEAVYELALPQSVIRAMDPGLACAELELPTFLSILWGWAMREDGSMFVTLAARLAAFSSYFGGAPQTWDAFVNSADTTPHETVHPHELYMPPVYRVECLPWVVKMQGVAP